MAEITQEEERVVQQFLDKVNRQRVLEDKGILEWKTGIKFLLARKFDLQRAIDLYQAHERTREREGLLHVDAFDELLQKELLIEKLTILPGRDFHGATVALFTAARHIPPQTTHQIVLKALIYQLDAALESIDTQRHGLVFIYDMTDSKYGNFDYELSKKILNMLKGGYPARLKKVLIVTAPLWFKAPFKILRLFVREKLRDRVHTVSLSQLPWHIPRESLPKQLGGTTASSHKVWLQICNKVATKQTSEVDSYFITCRKNHERGSRSSVARSNSSDISLLISDMDSEESKETVSEKHNHEDREKGIGNEENDIEKEVRVEKDDNPTNGTKRQRDSDSLSSSDSRKRVSDSERSTDDQNVSSLPCKKRPVSMGPAIFEESIHKPDDNGLTLEELVDHIKLMKRKGLYDEYASIKMEAPAGTFNTCRARYNIPKNRYSDVLCFDHSRVYLPQVEEDLSSDYINANFVDGYLQKNAYISTQGPLPKTFGDFWRTVWHTQCLVVVMTTRVVERGRTKCGQYWPMEEETEDQFEEFIVINTGIEQNTDYTITGLLLHNTKSGESRHITHLQFTSWPDYGVPPATGFLDFLYRVRACQSEATKRLGAAWQGHPLGPPVVVHCSAGIGRTGTFITTDISLRRLEHISTVDIRETVRRIRSQRAFSIQMPDQYVFCHLAIIDHALRQGLLGDIDWQGFGDSDSDTD
ncbi:hypothetical protein ScPMuIL_017765 [Solemya velum]